MIKLLTVIGARPQIIKSAALSRAISNKFSDDILEVLLHTGQHYDRGMSEVFFDEMNLPFPLYNLFVGSGSHGVQTAAMVKGIEEVLLKEKPDFIVLYGDTNSTIAGALAASKLNIRIIHIEAGLRSFNKKMPEEINRVLCDHVSSLLFTPTKKGFDNLIAEGFKTTLDSPYTIDNPGIFHCGDVMYDNSLFFGKLANEKSRILSELDIEPENFILFTLHRDFNTDNDKRLNQIFSTMLKISELHNETIVLPMHPRTFHQTQKLLDKNLMRRMEHSDKFIIIPPVSFLDMIQLEKNVKMIFTDSGGVQKEAYFFNKPVIILRPETEWVEIIDHKAGIIVDADDTKIMKAYKHFHSGNGNLNFSRIFGDGKAAEFICETILRQQNV